MRKDPSIQRRRWRFEGRVQGVGFRAFCRSEAVERNLRGWVRNEAGGAVVVEAEGPSLAVADLLGRLQTGHPWARVDRTEASVLVPANDPGGQFEIRF